jgi:hypothetical protein
MESKELGVDHFLFYDIATQEGGEVIRVKTQFDKRPEKIGLRAAVLFANPVSKNGEKIVDRNAHLTFYVAYDRIPDPTRVVDYTDQFGKRRVYIGRKFGFLSPTQKAHEGSKFPKRLDHYVAFEVLDYGEPVNRPVRLRDQWGRYESRVLYPAFFAAPSKKWHDCEVDDINNEKTHLAIYRITPNAAEKHAKSRDQFGSRPIHAGRTALLAVPCKKRRWKAFD